MSELTEIDVVICPIALTAQLPLTEHLTAVYLSKLSAGLRQAMRQALDAIAKLLTNDCCDPNHMLIFVKTEMLIFVTMFLVYLKT